MVTAILASTIAMSATKAPKGQWLTVKLINIHCHRETDTFPGEKEDEVQIGLTTAQVNKDGTLHGVAKQWDLPGWNVIFGNKRTGGNPWYDVPHGKSLGMDEGLFSDFVKSENRVLIGLTLIENDTNGILGPIQDVFAAGQKSGPLITALAIAYGSDPQEAQTMGERAAKFCADVKDKVAEVRRSDYLGSGIIAIKNVQPGQWAWYDPARSHISGGSRNYSVDNGNAGVYGDLHFYKADGNTGVLDVFVKGSGAEFWLTLRIEPGSIVD